jgi:hypothetical protein
MTDVVLIADTIHDESNIRLPRHGPGSVRAGAVTLTGPSVLRRSFHTWFSGYLLRAAS